ncbi:CPXCG motif-containing cysteine-rich protein [Echinicola pacifica]|uniref:CPXCG motif-containing cysteine-rich protein n=1 Tax=Echinicola pacifica TaxID=346377 RepID=UPI0009FEFE6A|nr:CPXCG motif-containing cysteine-rich protein [Echinicola pacifica]
MLTIEHPFTCPYCLSPISMILDLSVSGQEYIEDCEVCCRPIEVRYSVDQGELESFDAGSIEQ